MSDSQFDLGAYSYGKLRVKWSESGARLTFGKFCSFADNVVVYLGGNHRTDWITTYPFGHINTHTFNSFDGEGHPLTKGNVVIGNDVWIADNAIILSGIKIGDGAVIACNSVVAKDVEPYAIVGGNPARLIKKRFSDEQISKLLQIQWWNWSKEKINANLHLICSPDITQFIDKFYPVVPTYLLM